jgi:hypothetical protein
MEDKQRLPRWKKFFLYYYSVGVQLGNASLAFVSESHVEFGT